MKLPNKKAKGQRTNDRAGIADGRGNKLHERLYVVQTELDGTMAVRQPTLFLDLVLTPKDEELVGSLPDDSALPNHDGMLRRAEQALIEIELNRFLAEIRMQRQKEVETISQHMEISLNTIIDKVQCQFAELIEQKESGSKEAGLDGRIKQSEDRLFELNARLEQRREELLAEGSCTITDIRHHGSAWVLPHPERSSPEITRMVTNDEIERVAVEAVIAYEEARGWQVVSVEKENRGFDLISRQPHPEDPETAIAVRFIEVKGRSAIGEVALTANEYKTADRLKQDYWLYVVFNCASTLEVHLINDPVKLGWEPLVKIEHYYIGAGKILGGTM
jgi:hypothetical protein